MARSVKRWFGCVVALAVFGVLAPSRAIAVPIPSGAISTDKEITCDGINTGTVQLSTVDVVGLPNYGTHAWVISVSGRFDLVPNTGNPPDGSTLINATDGRQWKLQSSSGGVPSGSAGGSLSGTYPNPSLSATGISATSYGDASHVAVCTWTLEGRATGCVATPVSIAAAAISDSTTLGRSLLTASTTTAAQTAMGVLIGTNVQAFNANLSALSGLSLVADRLPYANGTGTLSLATFTAAARTWNALSSTAAQTAALNLFSASLQGMTPSSGGGTTNYLRADGTWSAPPGTGGGGITAGTGDVTFSGTGSVVTTLANIPSGVPATGSVLFNLSAAPSTPAAGKGSVWFDGSDFRLHDKDSGGNVGTTVKPASAPSHQFVTTFAASGVLGFAQPAIPDLQVGTSANVASVVSDETGSGSLVFGTSPSLTTPVLGVASGTSFNKVAITAPATSATLTIANGATLTASASATVSGTNTGDQTVSTMGASGALTDGTGTLGVAHGGTGVTSSTGSGAVVLGTAPTLTGATMAGALAASGNSITGIKQATYNGTVAGGNKTGANQALWDWTAGGIQTITLTGNITGTSTCTAPTSTARVQSFINQGTGSHTIASYCPNTHWIGAAPTPGTTPTLQTAASAVDVISCTYEATSTNYYCSMGSSN